MKALVTGGGGFLGSHIVKALLARGDGVRVLARGAYPELAAAGAQLHVGDVRDADAVQSACSGMDTVFHTAALAGGWGDPREFEATNVRGTQNILDACKLHLIPTLVYTSSPSVVHAHRDIQGDDESIPYATHFTAHYPRTKAEAERKVLAAATNTLRTVALRPHFIWGPGDRHLLPRLVSRARAGRLRRIGAGDPLTDAIYIDNCVDAHLLAAAALKESNVASGRAYFVSDGSPVGLWTMAERMLSAADAGHVGRPVPAWLAYGVGAMLEGVHAVFGIDREPLLTRFAASELSHAQWFDISAARRDLKYEPRVTIDEGMKRLQVWARPEFALK